MVGYKFTLQVLATGCCLRSSGFILLACDKFESRLASVTRSAKMTSLV
jgi:hypothetical protein